jgi:small subunit ribosomal protein S3Ae
MIMADEEKAKPQEEKVEKKVEEKKSASKLLKGKTWYTIVSPPFFGEKPLGEALASDASSLPGRKITASLMELTGDPARYYMTMRFKIIEVNGTVAKTIFDGHECTRDFAARIVQRFTQRIDTNSVVQLTDGKLRVKTIAICNRHVTDSVATSVRAKLKEMISAAAEGKSINDFVQLFTSGELQATIRAEANRIYPIRAFEFNKTEVL